MKQKEDPAGLEVPVRNDKITVIFSTRTHNQRHIDYIKKTSGLGKNIEIIQYINNGTYSLTELYNRGLKESTHDIVVFCHDDILFSKNGWGRKLLSHFNDSEYGILGVAGTTSIHENGKWWTDNSKMVGIVKHSHNGKSWDSKYSGNFQNKIIETVIVDGLFFGVHKKRIKEKFSLDIGGFHFYEVDFGFANHLLGVKVGVIFDIKIIHKSIGETNDQWEKNRINFISKWHGRLPYKMKGKILYDNKEIKLKNKPTVKLIVETYGDLLKCDNLLNSIKEKSNYENKEVWLIVNYKDADRYKILIDTYPSINIQIHENYSSTFIKFIEHHLNDIILNTDLIAFAQEDIMLVNDVITNLVNLYNKKNKEVGSLSCRMYDTNNVIYSCGQEILLNSQKLENGSTSGKIVMVNRGQNSYYNYDEGHIPCNCGGKRDFLMISAELLKNKDLFFNSTFKTYIWDLFLNLKLLHYNKSNYIDTNSIIKINGGKYSNSGLQQNEIYKKYLNKEMEEIINFLRSDEKVFKKAIKIVPQLTK